MKAAVYTSSSDPERFTQGPLRGAISDAVVSVYARAYGKGPTRAKTYLDGGDYALCLLGDPFTPAENTLIAMGRADVVHRCRRAFHDVVEDELKETVKRLTGRPVRTVIAGVCVESGLVSQLFVFGP